MEMLAVLDFLKDEPILIIPILGVLIPIFVVGVHYWYKVRRAEIDARLKEEMIARGMSADEVVRVLEAGSDRSEAEDRGELTKVPTKP